MKLIFLFLVFATALNKDWPQVACVLVLFFCLTMLDVPRMAILTRKLFWAKLRRPKLSLKLFLILSDQDFECKTMISSIITATISPMSAASFCWMERVFPATLSIFQTVPFLLRLVRCLDLRLSSIVSLWFLSSAVSTTP